MLVTFKSKGAGDIQMFSENAQLLLQIIGKTLDPPEAPRGIITADQVPLALAQLKAAATAARVNEGARADPKEAGAAVRVGLAQRAFPLIDLLERAAGKQQDVVWGV
jgi:hypothetical protein